jgi:DNA polymerase-3 subunit chi
MTTIDFYFNADDRLQVACRLAAKAASQNTRMVIYAPDGDTASRIDKLLWTWQALAFVPHCAPHDAIAAETPVLIAAGEETPEGFGVLLNLASQCPPHFERFERLCELVGRDDEEKQAGRARYRFYRERGYRITDHDLAHG